MLILLFFRYLFLVIDSCAYSRLFVPVLSLFRRFWKHCDTPTVAFVVALVGDVKTNFMQYIETNPH